MLAHCKVNNKLLATWRAEREVLLLGPPEDRKKGLKEEEEEWTSSYTTEARQALAKRLRKWFAEENRLQETPVEVK